MLNPFKRGLASSRRAANILAVARSGSRAAPAVGGSQPRRCGLCFRRGGDLPSKPPRSSIRSRASPELLGDFDGEEEEECFVIDYLEAPVPQDYYELLNIERNSSSMEIKSAYRKITKCCHPDIAGDEANDVCILVGEAYRTLSDDRLRKQYNEDIEAFTINRQEGYTGMPLSKWNDDPGNGPTEQRAVFVDECACIGCTTCAGIAPETFGMEPEYGRARVHTQWGDSLDKVEAAIESCPVDCIFFVKKNNLPVLEWCMTQAERVGVAVMVGGFNKIVDDPFQIANDFIAKGEERKARLKAQGLGPAEAKGDWVWGMGDSNLAFQVEMKRAWEKLKPKTRNAWN